MEVYKKTDERLQNTPSFDQSTIKALMAFKSRLAWQGHFCQRFERAHFMEWANLNPGFNGLREDAFNQTFFEAWKEGYTGFPFVDACMSFLRASGWINFRMRAMLMSFASYHLWLHWKPTGDTLANLFLDFEPGIHWSQVQMQSGTTGINIPRMYCPIKQQLDQDPTGTFVRKWVPEIGRLPTAYLSRPWAIPPLEAFSLGFKLGKTYPFPIVDPETALSSAKARYTPFFTNDLVKLHAKEIYEQHGSRKKRSLLRPRGR
jgi:deoxyribodipyrimidine photo-lyase